MYAQVKIKTYTIEPDMSKLQVNPSTIDHYILSLLNTGEVKSSYN